MKITDISFFTQSAETVAAARKRIPDKRLLNFRLKA